MDSKELAKKVYEDLKQAPEQFSKLQNEFLIFVESTKNVLEMLLLVNIKEMIKIKTEDEFFDFVAHLLDIIIVLPPIAEQVDYYIFRWLLKGLVDKILDKKVGENWYERFNMWLDQIMIKNDINVAEIRDTIANV